MRTVLLAAILLLAWLRTAGADDFGGHVKGQILFQDYSQDDIAAQPAGERVDLESIDSRWNAAWLRGSWDVTVQAQLDFLRGNLLTARNDPREAGSGSTQLLLPDVTDARQVLDLGWDLSDGESHLLFARLDRLSLGYTRGALAVRVGRQASSWGGGLVFQVLDLFDPFPPDVLDTEYKPGIDMLSAQWLFPSGDDLQAIVVPRRVDRNEPLTLSQSSAALKWRHFASSLQLELLGAWHYQDGIAGLGTNGNLAGGVWRFDLTTTFHDGGRAVTSFLFNVDRTWTWAERNIEGYVEFFRNGFGATSLDRHLETLPPALLDRLDRGELFNLGRNELAAGLRCEWSPLTTLEPTALVNLNDASAYLLLHLHHDLRQNLDLDAGVQFPFGGRGTEYGGVRSEAIGAYLAPGRTLWARLSRYF